MHLNFKKNGALISVIVLLLCVAVYLNWSYERNNTAEEASSQNLVSDTAGMNEDAITTLASDEERFEKNRWEIETANAGENTATDDERLTRLCADMDEMRLSLETSRSSELSLLRQTVENTESTAEAKASAEEQIASIAANSVIEAKIESLIVAKGFVDCIALVSADGISVVIVPQEAGLQASDVAKISDIILSETDFDTTQIRVIESQ